MLISPLVTFERYADVEQQGSSRMKQRFICLRNSLLWPDPAPNSFQEEKKKSKTTKVLARSSLAWKVPATSG